MSKTYDLGSQSDMHRFMSDIEKELKSQAMEEVVTSFHDFECPSCNRMIKVKVGQNTCPHCKQEIILHPPEPL